jgi:hypothetical protein
MTVPSGTLVPSQEIQAVSRWPFLPTAIRNKIIDYVGYSSESQVAKLLTTNNDFHALTVDGLRRFYRVHPQLREKETLAQYIIAELKGEEKKAELSHPEEKVSAHNVLARAVENYLSYHFGPDNRYSLHASRNVPAVMIPNRVYFYLDEPQQEILYSVNTRDHERITEQVLPQELEHYASIKFKWVAGEMLAFPEISAILRMMALKGYSPIVLGSRLVVQKMAIQFLQYYKEWIYEPFVDEKCLANEAKNNNGAENDIRNRFFEAPHRIEKKWGQFSNICISIPKFTAIFNLKDKEVNNFYQFLQVASYFTHFLHDLIATLQLRYYFNPYSCSQAMASLFVHRAQYFDSLHITRRTIAAYIRCVRNVVDFGLFWGHKAFEELIQNRPELIERLSVDDIVFLLKSSFRFAIDSTLEKLIKLPFCRKRFTLQDYGKLAFNKENAVVLLSDDFVLNSICREEEVFLKILLTSNQGIEAYLLSSPEIIERLNPYINGDCWYQLTLNNCLLYLPKVLQTPGVQEKLSAKQFFELFKLSLYVEKRAILQQPGIVEKLMSELSDGDKFEVLEVYLSEPIAPLFESSLLARINPYIDEDMWYAQALDSHLDWLPKILATPAIYEKISSYRLFKLLTGTWKGEELASQFLNQLGVRTRLHRELPAASLLRLNKAEGLTVEEEAKSISSVTSITADNFSAQLRDKIDGLDLVSQVPTFLKEINNLSIYSDARALLGILKCKLLDADRNVDNDEQYKYVVDVFLKSILVTLIIPDYRCLTDYLEDVLDNLIISSDSVGMEEEYQQKEIELDDLFENDADSLEELLDTFLKIDSTYLRDRYQQKKRVLSDLVESDAVKFNIQNLLTACEQVEKEIKQQTSIDKKLLAYRKLVTTLEVAHLAVIQKNPEVLYRYAQTLQKQPSLAWKMVGAALIAIGTVMVLIGTAIIPTGIGTAPGIALDAAGSALILSGMGFFHYGRRKGMCEAVHQLGECLPKKNIIMAGR